MSNGPAGCKTYGNTSTIVSTGDIMVSTWELKKTEMTAREILGSGRLELRGTTLGLLGDYWVKDIWP